jgi:short-subunit dehydrogenase
MGLAFLTTSGAAMSESASKGTAVITGASSGIGKVYAERLAHAGYDLILVARRIDRLRELAQNLQRATSRSIAVASADLTQPEDLVAVEAILRDKSVVLLVNNAGAGALGPVAAIGPDTLESVIKLNVLALTRLSHAALAGFRERNFGAVVNIASVIAFYPAAGAATYSGSKAYVLNFTRSLQLELADTNVAVQVVVPGPITTEFFDAAGVSPSAFPQHLFMSPEDLVDAALRDLWAKELISIPVLRSMDEWQELEDARLRFMAALRTGNKPANRYGLSATT